jgi:hypothetical protein
MDKVQKPSDYNDFKEGLSKASGVFLETLFTTGTIMLMAITSLAAP